MLVSIASPWHYGLPVLKSMKKWCFRGCALQVQVLCNAFHMCILHFWILGCKMQSGWIYVSPCKMHRNCWKYSKTSQFSFPVSKLTRWDMLGWGQQWGHWHSIYLYLKSSILSANLILLQFSICGYSNEVSLEARAFTDLNVMNKFHRISDVKTYETLSAKLAKQFILVHLSGPTWARNVP